MAALPVGSCGACRAIKAFIKNPNRQIKKHMIKFILAYVLFFGIVTIFLRNLEDYALKIYPTITSLEISVLLYSIYLYRDRLRFCTRKKVIILSLLFYNLLNAITVAFQLCNSKYVTTISYLLLTTVIVTILLTIYQNESDES